MKSDLQYISHGQSETGGYFHEKFLAQTLAEALENCSECYTEIRFRKNYKGPLAWLILGIQAFFATNRNGVTITVSRLAWPVWLKKQLGRGKMLLVLHNYDESDGKPALYHRLLRSFLKKSASLPKRIAVITVAQYWKNFIESEFRKPSILFPNFFNPAPYAFYAGVARKNPKLIHLGQYSEKIDKKKYLLLIHELKQRGFACYFSSNQPEFNSHFPISFFKTREAYLKQMAISGCTVILNQIKEGWNRVAHESLLVGTQIIVNPGAGPEELAIKFGGYVMNDIHEIVSLLTSDNIRPVNTDALKAHDENLAAEYIKPIIKFIQS